MREMGAYEQRFERALPKDLEAALADAPVAYVPLGTLEFHGWHMPFGFDALKAHALLLRACRKTGGMVLPPSYFGFAGGHRDYSGSIISEEELVAGNLHITLERLHAMGFRAAVVLTGHYPGEQVAMVHEVSEEATANHPDMPVLALAEPEAFEVWSGDHAAKWETSLGMELIPELVQMEAMAVSNDPLYGVSGDDPREHASPELGKKTADHVVDWLVTRVREMCND
jgi:creatinine amidohydrolase